MSEHLEVFRAYRGAYQHVGSLASADAELGVFTYAPDYLAESVARSISVALPLQREAFSPQATRVFFEGLLPEGELRRILAEALHTSVDAYTTLLARLNNESVGALVFSAEKTGLVEVSSYEAFDQDSLRQFSRRPSQVALDTALQSRLSLAGAQTKIGLYHKGADPLSGWFLPQGLAPSTHIVKASSETFPRQTLNEAFCLLVARLCGFDVAQSFPISVEGSELLLAVERFDRTFPAVPQLIGGMAIPQRLHQEDLCQAAGIPAFLKYEPTDGHYLALVTRVLNRVVANPLQDRVAFFERVLFDYLIGNCDNHLKNYSLLWDESWGSCALAPLYDVTCTTMYPGLSRDMGIALCASRRIDDVKKEDILQSAQSVGITKAAGWERYRALCERFPEAVGKATGILAEQGLPEAAEIAHFILADSSSRRAL